MNDPINTPSDRAPKDSFFILRDSRLLFQRRLTEIAQWAGVVSPSIIECFTEALGEAHDELAVSNHREGFEQAKGLTASRITLMCDADLELEIRIAEIARRLEDVSGYTLWRAHLRYITLLGRPEMLLEDNPVGPQAICQGLWAICRSSSMGLESKFTLLDRIEEQLGLHLPDLYGALNDLLASRKIESAQTHIASTGGVRSAIMAQADSKQDSLSVLQSMLNLQLGNAAAGARQGYGYNEASGGSIGGTPGHGEAGGNIALNTASFTMLNQLAARLDQLELSGANNSLPATAGNAEESTLPRIIRATDLDLPLDKPEAIALDTLGHIFEAIFGLWELPDTVKTAISRLQIPILKLAIFDPSLFSDTEHPARRLINNMGRAAVGLPRNISRAHPVSQRLWQLAGTVSETLQGDASALIAPLADLDALIAERDRAVQAAAQPYISLLHENQPNGKASLAAQNWLEVIERQGAAQEIVDFLRRYWVRVMEAASSEDNETGSLWQESDATIVDLLWSVQPKQNTKDRKRLVALVPTLLKRISAGLDQIGTPSEERTAFLDACFALQTAALRGNPPVPVKLADTALQTNEAPEAGIVVEIIEADGKQLKILTLAEQSPADSRSPVSQLQPGSWLQFGMHDSAPLTGLVCWLDPQSGNALLFNRYWGYAVALAPEVVEQQLRDTQAKVVSSQAIFEIAAERALSQLAGA